MRYWGTNLILSFLFSLFLIAPITKADQYYLINDLSSNQNLTQTDKKYQIQSDLVINENIILTVSPGASLFSDNKIITVKGKIEINGTADHPIIIDNIFFDFQSGSTLAASHCFIKGSLAADNANISITNTKIESDDIALSFANLKDLSLVGNSITAKDKAVLLENVNSFSLQYNHIAESDTAIYIVNSSGHIKYNQITDNGLAIYTDSNILITRNNFSANKKSKISPTDPVGAIFSNLPFNTPQNWWGCPSGPIAAPIDDNPCEIATGPITASEPLPAEILLNPAPHLLKITEVMPYPATNSSLDGHYGEWLELFYSGQTPVVIFDFQIFDITINSNGETSTPYFETIPIFTLQSNSYFIIADQEDLFLSNYPDFSGTIISIPEYVNSDKNLYIGNGLSNTNGFCQIQLNGNILDEVKYGEVVSSKVQKGKTYAKVDDKWYWLDPSPGLPNQSPPAKPLQQEANIPQIVIPPPEPRSCPTAPNIKDLINYLGCVVEIKGTVRRPNSAYIYLFDGQFEIRVYRYKFPLSFKTGDVVKAKGLVELYQGALRIKPVSPADLIITKNETPPPVKTVKTPEISESKKEDPQVISSPRHSAPTILPKAKLKTAISSANNIKQDRQSTNLPLKISLISGIVLLIANTLHKRIINEKNNP